MRLQGNGLLPIHCGRAGTRLTRTVQLLLGLAAYLLVTAVLKDTLGLSQRICCGLAIGEQMHTFAFLVLPSAVCYTVSAAGEAQFVQGQCT